MPKLSGDPLSIEKLRDVVGLQLDPPSVAVVYEDLVRNYESNVRRLLDHLKIGLPRQYVFPTPRRRKQADAVSEEWVERYQRDARSNRMWRTVASLPALLLRRRICEAYVFRHLRGHTDYLTNLRRRLSWIVSQPPGCDRQGVEPSLGVKQSGEIRALIGAYPQRGLAHIARAPRDWRGADSPTPSRWGGGWSCVAPVLVGNQAGLLPNWPDRVFQGDHRLRHGIGDSS